MRTALLGLAVLVLSAGCSSLEVNHDFDSNANFAGYSSFAWLPPSAEGRPVSELNAKRIERAIEGELGTRGIQQNASSPDLLVAYHVGTQDKIQVTDWGYNYGSYYWGWGGRSVDVYQYEEGTLVIDIVDAQTKNLVWRGWATGTIDRSLSPEAVEAKINNAVAQIMKRYPPK
jgi:hypothetical protein